MALPLYGGEQSLLPAPTNSLSLWVNIADHVRCFYSRKSFFFPERQSGPHKDWRDEVNFLDGIFGALAYVYR